MTRIPGPRILGTRILSFETFLFFCRHLSGFTCIIITLQLCNLFLLKKSIILQLCNHIAKTQPFNKNIANMQLPENQATSGGVSVRAGNSGNIPPAAHRFKPGQSGCPGGKPAGLKSIKSLIQKYGNKRAPAKVVESMIEKFPWLKGKITLHDAVLMRVYESAIAGESWAVQFLAERGEGKVPTNFNMHASGLGDIIFQVMNDEQKEKITNANAAADNI